VLGVFGRVSRAREPGLEPGVAYTGLGRVNLDEDLFRFTDLLYSILARALEELYQLLGRWKPGLSRSEMKYCAQLGSGGTM